jgi:superfamily II DNA or RNA helicase
MARELRPHQQLAITLLRQSLMSGHRRPMIQSATGSGKTVLAGSIINGALSKGNRVIMTVPSISLVDQTYSSLFDDGIYDVGVMQSDHPQTNPAAPVQIASLDTLFRRQLPTANVVLVDEAHRRSKFLSQWMRLPGWEKVPFIGLSATPWTKGLGKDFDDLIIAATTKDLIEKGYLSPFVAFGSQEKPDLSSVGTVADDFNKGNLAKEMQKPKLVADAVQTWLEKGENRPTLCFAVDCAHAQTLQTKFEKAGVPTAYIDAHTSRNDREMIRRRFQSGEVKVVCNVGCLTTGVDWDVRCIVLCRPTKSEILYTQMIGRGLRTANGKENCVILDHSDTTTRLGFVTDIHHERLDNGKPPTASAKKEEKEEREERLPRECMNCAFIMPQGVQVCPDCGFDCGFRKSSKIVHAAGELKQLNGKAIKYDRDTKQLWYSMFLYIGKEKGRKQGWVSHQYKEKFGVWPKGLSEETATPSIECRNFIKARQIAFAKKNEAGRIAA